MLPGLAHAFVYCLTLFWALSLANEWGVAELDLLIKGDLLVLDETVLDEVLFTLLFLLRLKVGGVGGVAPLRIAVLALDHIVILSFLNHHNLNDRKLDEVTILLIQDDQK